MTKSKFLTEVQQKDVLTESSDIDKAVKSLVTAVTTLTNKTFIVGVSICSHFLKHRDTTSLNRWFNELPNNKALRKSALGLWLKDMLSLDYNVKDGFIYVKDEYNPKDISEIMKSNPFDYSPDIAKGFNFDGSLDILIKKAIKNNVDPDIVAKLQNIQSSIEVSKLSVEDKSTKKVETPASKLATKFKVTKKATPKAKKVA